LKPTLQLSQPTYMVGHYHIHATLRNQNDINNAASFPTGPSAADRNFATNNDSPGLVRDRHLDEIVATGHIDHFYGPTRRRTP
jgi:hypothetical protein